MLTPSERAELNHLGSSANPDEILRLRALIILSWAAGATGEDSARLLETSRRTVSKWRGRFREGGVAALSDRPRAGAPRIIEESKIAEVLELLESPRPPTGARWSTRKIAEHTGLSQSTVARIARDYIGEQASQ